MDYIKQNNDNTLLLVDLDTIITDNNNDETTDHHFSCSTTTTCSTFTDSRIHWIQRVIRDLNNIPVVGKFSSTSNINNVFIHHHHRLFSLLHRRFEFAHVGLYSCWCCRFHIKTISLGCHQNLVPGRYLNLLYKTQRH
jgi:hypothetical protein